MAHHKALPAALVLLLAASLAACGGDVDIQQKNGKLVAISLTPAGVTVAKNSTYQFIATGIYSNNTTQDLTASVTWETSNASIAVVSNAAPSQGMATFISTGTTTIAAAWEGISGSTTASVTTATLVMLAVTPNNPNAPRGTSLQFTATGTYSDNTTQDLTASVTWSSPAASVATISNAVGSKGLATAAATGSTTISATMGGVSGSTTLTVTPATLVSIAVTPVNPSIARGTIRQFMATGTYSDNSTQDLTAVAAWTSSQTTVATVSNIAGSRGSATAQSVGATTISAVSGGISGSTVLTVTPATLASIAVAPAAASIARGTNRQFTATGTYSDTTTQDLTVLAAWYSSNTGVATISNAAGSKGMASSLATGSTVVTAASGSISGTAALTVTPATLVSITVTPASPSLAKGTSRQFIATGTYSDNSTQVLTASATWSSSNAAIAAISNAAGSKGSASALTAGTVTITAASGTVSGSTTLTVTAATLVSITITPVNPSASQGASQQFIATGNYSDASTQSLTASVTWSSSAPGVASISNAAGSQGLATAIAPGMTTMTAISGSVSSTTAFTVTAASPGTATLTWDAPTTYTDGTPATTITGYRIYYGTAPGSYSKIIDTGNATTWTITGLASGAWYFVVTAYDSFGMESDYSNELSKTIL
jgi:hypothetical protein